MYTKVYVVTDQTAIEYLQNDDLEGFKQYLSEDETLDFGDPIYFSGEKKPAPSAPASPTANPTTAPSTPTPSAPAKRRIVHILRPSTGYELKIITILVNNILYDNKKIKTYASTIIS